MTGDWWKLTIPVGSPVAIVLDAGEDVVKLWPQAYSLTSRLVDLLPVTRPAQVFFLGNGTPYDARQFRSLAAVWREENRARTRLVNPTFDQLADAPSTTIVMLMADIPFDIDDWADSSLMGRTVCVRLSDNPIAPLRSRECPPDCDRLAEKLQQKISSVRVTTTGGMPVYWDNNSFHVNGEALEAVEAEDYSVTIGWLNASAAPQAEGVWSDGTRELLSLVCCEPIEPTGWRVLTEREARAYRAAITGIEVPCPNCDQKHRPDEVKCRSGRNFLGTPLYGADLARHRGFVVFQERAGGTECRAHSCGVLQLSQEVVAVYCEGRARLKRFSPTSCAWIDSGDFQQYQSVEGGGHAILL